jgi:hypothetical protein
LGASRAGSCKGWELQECPNKRSFNVVVAGARTPEDLQGGGRSGSLKVRSLLLLLIFAFFFVAKKMTTMSSSSSFVSSCCEEEDDNGECFEIFPLGHIYSSKLG